MRKKRRRRYQQKQHNLFLITKIALIFYLTIFGIGYMSSETSAYLSSQSGVSQMITAGVWEEESVGECDKDIDENVLLDDGINVDCEDEDNEVEEENEQDNIIEGEDEVDKEDEVDLDVNKEPEQENAESDNHKQPVVQENAEDEDEEEKKVDNQEIEENKVSEENVEKKKPDETKAVVEPEKNTGKAQEDLNEKEESNEVDK